MPNSNSNQSADPRWGSKDRDKKAEVILKTLSHYNNTPILHTTWVDIGCGSGGIAAAIAPNVTSITGIDPESWERWKEFQNLHPNLRFLTESIEHLSCMDNSVDTVICNQVYEHVPDPKLLISEIYRILKPGGYCYFAGPNLIFPIEPHVFWPFVHWLPRKFSITLMRMCGSKSVLDAYSVSYWTLKNWLNSFEICNAVPFILKNPEIFHKTKWWWKIISLFPYPVLNSLTWMSPGFVFVLRKP